MTDGLLWDRGAPTRRKRSSQNPPGPAAAAPGHLAEAKLGNHVLRRARRHTKRGRDHAGRGDRPRQHEFHQSWQLRAGAAALDFALQAPPGEQPAVVVLHSRRRSRRDRLQEGGEPRRPVRGAARLARDAAQCRIHTKKMRPRFPPRPQRCRNVTLYFIMRFSRIL